MPERSLEKIWRRKGEKGCSIGHGQRQQVTRSVGFAIIRLDKYFTVDEVVFAEQGDSLSVTPTLLRQSSAICYSLKLEFSKNQPNLRSHGAFAF